MSEPLRLFAVIPAAGHSRRMGRPKLLLPLGSEGRMVIERVLAVLDHPRIVVRCVVVRAGDAALQEAARRAGGHVLQPPIDPPDMRTSVEFALEHLRRDFSPREDDGWLLVPADHPVLDRALIEALLDRWQRDRPRILVPRSGDRRGHPTLFRWSLASQVARMPPDQGLNWLLREHPGEVCELPDAGHAALTDLDTPADYERLREQHS